jgi:hypothetical protein
MNKSFEKLMNLLIIDEAKGTVVLKDSPKKKPSRARNGYLYFKIGWQKHFIHRLIIMHNLGKPLKSDQHVHHINKKRNDNRIENLQLLKDTEHFALHFNLSPNQAELIKAELKKKKKKFNFKTAKAMLKKFIL